MTKDCQQATICVRCRHMKIGHPEYPTLPLCYADDPPIINYVTGAPNPISCIARNDDGKCRFYAPIPEGSDPATLHELNAAVEAGEV